MAGVLWTAISWVSVGSTITLQGHISVNNYMNILGDQVHSMIQNLSPSRGGVFQNDKVPVHTAHIVQDWFSEHEGDLSHLPHSSYHTSILIEPLWAPLERKMCGLYPPPSSLSELKSFCAKNGTNDLGKHRGIVFIYSEKTQAVLNANGFLHNIGQANMAFKTPLSPAASLGHDTTPGTTKHEVSSVEGHQTSRKGYGAGVEAGHGTQNTLLLFKRRWTSKRALKLLLGRLVSESAWERKDPGSNHAVDMVDAARNTAWDLSKQPNNYRRNYPTQEWARSLCAVTSSQCAVTCSQCTATCSQCTATSSQCTATSSQCVLTYSQCVVTCSQCTTTWQPVCSNLQPVYSNLQPVWSNVQPVCSNLQPVYSNLQPVYSNLQPVYSNLQPVYSNLQPVSSNLQPVSSNLQPVYSNLQPVYSNLQPVCTNLQPEPQVTPRQQHSREQISLKRQECSTSS
ncbi:hypothetical protein FHG87_015924 [Trinorchestia longiramus]|nr:hypothetical protein FHG87_015924 [Trinorchestia longiramus]